MRLAIFRSLGGFSLVRVKEEGRPPSAACALGVVGVVVVLGQRSWYDAAALAILAAERGRIAASVPGEPGGVCRSRPGERAVVGAPSLSLSGWGFASCGG